MAKQVMASQIDADGNKIKDRQVGWFVGFVPR